MKNNNILYIFFLTSLIILSINILYLIMNNKKNELKEKMINKIKIELYEKIDLKNNDNYFINFSLLPYKKMAKELKTCKNNSELFNNISLLSKN